MSGSAAEANLRLWQVTSKAEKYYLEIMTVHASTTQRSRLKLLARRIAILLIVILLGSPFAD